MIVLLLRSPWGELRWLGYSHYRGGRSCIVQFYSIVVAYLSYIRSLRGGLILKKSMSLLDILYSMGFWSSGVTSEQYRAKKLASLKRDGTVLSN